MSKLTFQETLPSSDEDYSSSDNPSDDSANDGSSDAENDASSDHSSHVPEESFADLENDERPSKRSRQEPDARSITMKAQPSKGQSFGTHISTFLSTFLSTKKNPIIPEAPVFPQMRDDILREFSESTKQRAASNSAGELRRLSVTSIDSLPSFDGNDYNESSSDESEGAETAADRSTNLTLQLFNLPYAMTDNEVLAAALSYGIAAESATIVMDKKTNRPSGSALISLHPPIHAMSTTPDDETRSIAELDLAYAIECLNKLQETNFSGRPVRVRAMGSRARTSLGGGGGARYFGGDISVKCHSCGETGHRMADCPNDNVMPPCHLCAGTDHEPVNCTNIACHRCFRFGHHSRNCLSARQLRPIVCTLCGSRTHNKRFCRLSGPQAVKRVEEPLDSIICLCCGRTGHAMCLMLPVMKNRTLFCPACGGEGHHIDYVRDADKEPSCKNPRSTGKPSGDNSDYSSRRDGSIRGSGHSGDFKGSARYRGNQHGGPPSNSGSASGGSRSSSYPGPQDMGGGGGRGGRVGFTSGRTVEEHQSSSRSHSLPPSASKGCHSGAVRGVAADVPAGSGPASGFTSLSSRFQEYDQQKKGFQHGYPSSLSSDSRAVSSSHSSGAKSGYSSHSAGSVFSRGGGSAGRNGARR